MEEDEVLSLLPRRIDLPRGRSALSETEVAESRRGRLMQATIDEIAESGYAATTVAAITKRAHVSRSAFYEAFSDKEEAFSAAHRNASELALRRVWTPALSGGDERYDGRIRRGITIYLRTLEAFPSFAICFFVEIRAAGERLLAQRDEMIDRHLEVLRDATVTAARANGLTVPSAQVGRALSGSFDELIGRAVRTQRHADRLQLVDLAGPLTGMVLAVMNADPRHVT